jgi:hypothetical protein
MGLEMLPDELLLVLKEQWPCRESQLRQLDAVLSVSLFARDRKSLRGLTNNRNSLVYQARLPWSHTAPKPRERATSSDHTWKRAANGT